MTKPVIGRKFVNFSFFFFPFLVMSLPLLSADVTTHALLTFSHQQQKFSSAGCRCRVLFCYAEGPFRAMREEEPAYNATTKANSKASVLIYSLLLVSPSVRSSIASVVRRRGRRLGSKERSKERRATVIAMFFSKNMLILSCLVGYRLFDSTEAWVSPSSRSRSMHSVVRLPHTLHRAVSHQEEASSSWGNTPFSPRKQQQSLIPQSLRQGLVTLGVAVCCLVVPDAGWAESTTTSPSALASSPPSAHLLVGQKYWTIMQEGEPEAKVMANVALMDYAVGTINTMYYDHSGGAIFQPRDFFKSWREWLDTSKESLESREGVEKGLRFLASQLQDPYSRYLTRDELIRERAGQAEGSAGFLQMGVMVEAPSAHTFFRSSLGSPVLSDIPPGLTAASKSSSSAPPLLSARTVQSLPVAMAVKPHSPAERMGLTVGDRVVTVGTDSFLPGTKNDRNKPVDVQAILDRWKDRDPSEAMEMTIAKPVYAVTSTNDRDVIIAYRPQRLRLPDAGEIATAETEKVSSSPVRFDLLQGRKSSLFSETRQKVGYIRMTGFSKSATTAFVDAINTLEKVGADAYILDLRNNYGGVIQEAMLAASSVLRDPHAVLCFTMNAGGGFAPHDVEEYVTHERYPGYLLSTESRSATRDQVKKESPEVLNGKGDWSPPSSYASLREQTLKRHIHRASMVAATAKDEQSMKRLAKQKSLVLLVNEGTASSAEVFASALRDNGRTVAIVGTKTFGKGLIQHTFPLPDGGALRLTVAEYLTPSLHHVTHVGAAQFDQSSGRWIGGGIKPDILCESKGIPTNTGGDLCVGLALDALSEADSRSSFLSRSDASRPARPRVQTASLEAER